MGRKIGGEASSFCLCSMGKAVIISCMREAVCRVRVILIWRNFDDVCKQQFHRTISSSRQARAPGRHRRRVHAAARPCAARAWAWQITGSDMNASVSTEELHAQRASPSPSATARRILRARTASSARPPPTTTTPRSPPRAQRASRFLSAHRRGAIIMRAYRNAICVSGTHGKTTTTSMLTQIFMQARPRPDGHDRRQLFRCSARGTAWASGDTIILESCEYCNSFLNFFPTAAVVLDVDADHLDFFKDLAGRGAFVPRALPRLCPADGLDRRERRRREHRRRAARHGLTVRFGFAETNDVCGSNFSADFR